MPWTPYPLDSINEEEAFLLRKGRIKPCDTCAGEGWQWSRGDPGRWACPRCRGAGYMIWRTHEEE